MTESIVLLNEIKYVLSENCMGTATWNGLGHPPCGLTLEEICHKLPLYSNENIKSLLELETQTFYFNNQNSCWVMFPKIVDTIKHEVKERKYRMSKLYNDKQLSRFISYDSYKSILLFRKEDFNEILCRCEEIAECDSKNVHLSATEIWNIILNTSDNEFYKRVKIMKSNTIKNNEHFKLLLNPKKVSLSEIYEALSNLDKQIAKLEQEEHEKKNQKHKIQFVDFVIKSYVFKCNANHNIEQIQAQIDLMLSNGTIITESISAGYCHTCKCYFILESDFNKLRNKGIVLCQQITYEVYRQRGPEILNGDELRPESLLHQCGYNVSAAEELTSVQRQEILCRVIDNGLYSTSGICSHLDWLISRNKKITSRDMSTAISKWQEDRLFISKYNPKPQRNLGVSSIRKTNYK